MKKEPEDVSHVSSDTGNVESSERTLDGFESGVSDATDGSSLHSNVEFEGGSDSHLSNCQFFAFEQAPHVELVPKNESTFVNGIGHVIEGSERTLDEFESDGNDVTDKSYGVSSRPYPSVEFEGGSDSGLSNSQFFAFEQAPYVESVPENEITFVNGIEHVERMLDEFESDDNDVADESYSVSSRPYSDVEFERGSDSRLPNSQFSMFEQAAYVDSEPKNDSPFVTGIGYVIEGSERTLDEFESDGSDVTDESYIVSSRPYSSVEFEGGSDSQLPNSQFLVFEQALYVESAPKNDSPYLTGIGLDGCESEGSDVTDVSNSVSSRPYSNVKLRPENEGPLVTGIGHIVQGSERTLDGFESDGNDAPDESSEFPSSPLSDTLPYLNSNEFSRGPEDPKALQCVLFSQSAVSKSYAPLPNSGPMTLAVGGGTASIHVAVHHLCK
jgi:hypothetical protein